MPCDIVKLEFISRARRRTARRCSRTWWRRCSTNERIRTTDAKAKETRRLAERTITWARRVSDVLGKKPDRRTIDESSRVVHAMRMARRVVRDRGAVLKLFDELAPRFFGRAGGYTRIVKLPPASR